MDYRDPDVIAAIKADDPGGTVESATTTLATMTVTQVTETRYSWQGLASKFGASRASEFVQKLEAARDAAGSPPANVVKLVLKYAIPFLFEPEGTGGGLDLGDTETRALLDYLAANDLIAVTGNTSVQVASGLKALAEKSVVKYPGIRAVDVKWARGH